MSHSQQSNVRYRFGDFVFDKRSGQLTRLGGGAASVVRLAPQPAKLLTLLLEQHPGIVHRADIQQHIWPDVEVAFEQSLHHCIRQIRHALGDSASEPQYIRTIHRRGYQFIADVEAISDNALADVPAQVVAQRSMPRQVVAGVGVGVLVVLVAWLLVAPLFAEPPVRVGIMTFQPPGQHSQGTPIAERLVARLTNHPEVVAEVIGPTSTTPFEQQPGGLRALVEAFDIDYILNGRFPADSTEARFLAEVIRASDGAHVWVHYFDVAEPDSFVASTIAEAFVAYHREHR